MNSVERKHDGFSQVRFKFVTDKKYIELYKKYNGSMSAVARYLGVSRQAVHFRLKRLGYKGTGCKFSVNETKRLKEKILKINNPKISDIKKLMHTSSSKSVIKFLEDININIDFRKNHKKRMTKRTSYEIVSAYESANGNILKASRSLGIAGASFHRYIKAYNLNLKGLGRLHGKSTKKNK